MQKVKFLLLLILFGAGNAFAQVSIENVQAELDNTSRKIIIKYDLIAKGKVKNDVFNVKVFLSTDGGGSFEQELKIVGGSAGNDVTPGKNKRIEWQYFREDRNFTGQNIAFQITAEVDYAERLRRQKQLAGPEAALNSLIFPGWGQSQVREGKGYWMVGAAGYLCLGGGIYYASQANQSADSYLAATNPNDADAFFSDSESQRQLSTILYGTAAVIWVGDIALTVLKGLKNKSLTKEDAKATAWNIRLQPQTQTPMLSWTFKF